jgi:ABC-type molybdate transport system substrate-binding protein
MLRAFVATCAIFAIAALLLGSVEAANPVEFSVPPVDEVLDLHGDPVSAQLVVFAAGNEYMAMPALLAAFRRDHPNVRRVFYETLPPGIVIRQMETGAVKIGNLLISVKPDVLLAGPRGMRTLHAAGKIARWHAYASNTLAILVRAGNPREIRSLSDLGRADVRVVMPNPQWEGVAEKVEDAYAKAGGAALVREIMHTKVAAGATMLTRIHHRETPLYLLQGRADAGPVWLTEALYLHRTLALGFVRIPPEKEVYMQYEAAFVDGAPHAAAAREFVTFMQSSQARAILKSYGFGPPR